MTMSKTTSKNREFEDALKRLEIQMEMLKSSVEQMHGEMEDIKQRLRVLDLNYRLLKNDRGGK